MAVDSARTTSARARRGLFFEPRPHEAQRHAKPELTGCCGRKGEKRPCCAANNGFTLGIRDAGANTQPVSGGKLRKFQRPQLAFIVPAERRDKVCPR